MRITNTLAKHGSSFSLLTGRIKTILLKHPEGKVWLLSAIAWCLLTAAVFIPASELQYKYTYLVVYCTPGETFQHYESQGFFSAIRVALSAGLLPWTVMIIAMMFPLLNKPVRHVAFSVKRKDRNLGMVCFLTGYAVTWIIIGAVYLIVPVAFNILISDQPYFINVIIKSSIFLLPAALSWHPARAIKMNQCNQTMPIRIAGWQLHYDCLVYGLKMAFICLSLCWASMAAVVLTRHNPVLMLLVTVILVFERYVLPHTSKLPGYAWISISFTSLIFEIAAMN